MLFTENKVQSLLLLENGHYTSNRLAVNVSLLWKAKKDEVQGMKLLSCRLGGVCQQSSLAL
jgi:hypothetical protein